MIDELSESESNALKSIGPDEMDSGDDNNDAKEVPMV